MLIQDVVVRIIVSPMEPQKVAELQYLLVIPNETKSPVNTVTNSKILWDIVMLSITYSSVELSDNRTSVMGNVRYQLMIVNEAFGSPISSVCLRKRGAKFTHCIVPREKFDCGNTKLCLEVRSELNIQ